ncbi:hypothetical protein [Salmonirosea aquatica]|uniref:hypothetical protein n=1 Tax=Salmonirosea aquatica TaxID=2654236 RepID=UPI003570F968
MKKITIEWDARVLFLVLGILAIGAIAAFTPKDVAQAENGNGRYQAVSSERGFIILDTRTGQYILDSQVGYGKQMTWIKGDFAKSYQKGTDKSGE